MLMNLGRAEDKAGLCNAPAHSVGAEVLGADIRRIGVSGDLLEQDRAVANPLLHPELAHRQMSDTADAAPSADADGR